MTADSSRYRRGQVWMITDPDCSSRKEGIQSGNRPYLIISSDGNETSNIITALACTTNKDRARYKINTTYRSTVHNTDSVILCNQVRTFSVQELSKARYIETLSENVMNRVEESFMTAMGISKKFNGATLEELKRTINEIAEESINNSSISNNVTEDMIIDIAVGLESIFSKARSDRKKQIADTKRNVKDINEGVLLLHKAITDRSSSKAGGKPEEEEKDYTQDIEEPTKSSRSKDNNKKKRRSWTEESMIQFVEDKKNMKINDFIDKYEFEDSKSALKMYYQVVYRLRKMGKDI